MNFFTHQPIWVLHFFSDRPLRTSTSQNKMIINKLDYQSYILDLNIFIMKSDFESLNRL